MSRGNLTITVARKPVSGTVAKNALKWGTGGLNIDDARVPGLAPTTVQVQSTCAGSIYGADQRHLRRFEPSEAGRWPSNVLLVHKTGCRKVGTKQVPAGTNTDVYGTFLETVDDWECAEGCPVAGLDQQSGDAARFFQQFQEGDGSPGPGSA